MNRFQFLFITSILCMSLLDAQAKTTQSECPSFRLDSAEQPLTRVPPKNQSYTGACYAAVATTLFDYMRAVDGATITDPASMLSAALDYKTEIDDDVRNGPRVLDSGFAPQLLELLIKKGACTNSTVSKNMRISELTENQVNDIYAVFTYRLNELRNTLPKNKLNLDSLNLCLKNFKDGLSDDLGWINQSYNSQSCNSNRFVSFADSLMRVNPELACLSVSTLTNKLPLGCKNENRVKLKSDWDLETKEFTETDTADSKKEYLNRVFFNAQSKNPVGVSFPYCILTNYNPSIPIEQFYSKDECKAGGHAAVLIGQKWNLSENRCEVILRNSERKIACSEYSGWNCNLQRKTVNIDKDAFIAGIRATTFPLKKR